MHNILLEFFLIWPDRQTADATLMLQIVLWKWTFQKIAASNWQKMQKTFNFLIVITRHFFLFEIFCKIRIGLIFNILFLIFLYNVSNYLTILQCNKEKSNSFTALELKCKFPIAANGWLKARTILTNTSKKIKKMFLLSCFLAFCVWFLRFFISKKIGKRIKMALLFCYRT